MSGSDEADSCSVASLLSRWNTNNVLMNYIYILLAELSNTSAFWLCVAVAASILAVIWKIKSSSLQKTYLKAQLEVVCGRILEGAQVILLFLQFSLEKYELYPHIYTYIHIYLYELSFPLRIY